MTASAKVNGLSKGDVMDAARHCLFTANQTQEYVKFFERVVEEGFAKGDLRDMFFLIGMNGKVPVGIEEFLFSRFYLNRPKNELYPAVVEELIKINNPSGGSFITNPYTQTLFTGSIGSAKTTCALYTTAYQLYLLSLYISPHQMFHMDSTSEILFIFQSMSGSLAKTVGFGRFKEICKQSYYFTFTFPFDRSKESILVFSNRIEVRPIGSDMGAIGQNVIGGVIDELNFMAVVESSRKTVDKGTYDQARAIYNAIVRRRKSRFMEQGHMPGIMCLVSSKRYPGEFTDQILKDAETDPSIYIYDKRTWDIKPEGTYSGKTFPIFIGDISRRTRILDPGDPLIDREPTLVMHIPVEHQKDFEDDPFGALRDVAGVSTLSRHPFMMDVGRVSRCFTRRQSIFNLEECDLSRGSLEFYPDLFENPKYPRWVHIDLGVTHDAAGLAIGCCPGFKIVDRGHDEKEQMPLIQIDGILRVVPPKGGEILFWRIRDVLYALRDHGLNIKWVSFDTFQSVDSTQTLRAKGFITGNVSMDRDSSAYDMSKAAFYEDRIQAHPHDRCLKEFLSLERDFKTGKIDHPPNFGKDCSDAVAGVVKGLTFRREIWGMFGVNWQTFFMYRDKSGITLKTTEVVDESHRDQ